MSIARCSIRAFLVMICVCLLPNSSVSAPPWKIGHVRGAGSAIDADIRRMTEMINRQTGGTITFDVLAGGKLGDYSVVQERVSFGEVEMFVGPFGTAIDRRLMLAFIPFLVDSWQQAEQLYAHDGLLMRHLAGFLAEQNITIVGGWPVYFGGIALSRERVLPLDDQRPSRSIIRVPPIKSFELTARALGYQPYPITWTYAMTGLRTGMVQGLLGGGAEGYSGVAPLIRYYLPVKDHFEYWFVYINSDLWQRLSDNQREAITGAARKIEVERYLVGERLERESEEALRDQGVEVYEFSKEQREQMEKIVRSEVWPILSRDIGPAFDEVIRSVD